MVAGGGGGVGGATSNESTKEVAFFTYSCSILVFILTLRTRRPVILIRYPFVLEID
jgi:hypothetical protein